MASDLLRSGHDYLTSDDLSCDRAEHRHQAGFEQVEDGTPLLHRSGLSRSLGRRLLGSLLLLPSLSLLPFTVLVQQKSSYQHDGERHHDGNQAKQNAPHSPDNRCCHWSCALGGIREGKKCVTYGAMARGQVHANIGRILPVGRVIVVSHGAFPFLVWRVYLGCTCAQRLTS